MAESRDLYLAILAMDVYNRGYEDNLSLTGSQIGDATILNLSDYDPSGVIYNSWQDVGFYALAYDTSNVGAISDDLTLSFRGTNAALFDDLGGSPILTDAINGWSAALGFIDGVLGSGGQVPLALDFYQGAIDVYGEPYTEPEDPDDPDSPLVTRIRPRTPEEITTAGHSLGGGLAGVVAALYGTEGTLFDHMPYELVSDAVIDLAISDPAAALRYFDLAIPGGVQTSGIDAYSTFGEFLSAARLLLGSPYESIPRCGIIFI